MADWGKIREEYIKDESASYRKLAKKHGVTLQKLSVRAKAENWVDLRKRVKDKTITKSIEKISDKQTAQINKYNDMVDTMTAKLTEAIAALNPRDTTAVRRLTASLCDLRDLLGVKSDADAREQEARIANYRRQAEKGENNGGGNEEQPCGVIMMPAIMAAPQPPAEDENE